MNIRLGRLKVYTTFKTVPGTMPGLSAMVPSGTRWAWMVGMNHQLEQQLFWWRK